MRQPCVSEFLKPLSHRERGWGEGTASREIQNRFKHRPDFQQHLIVPESQDKQALALQSACTYQVAFFVVLRTIELDHQLELVAVKVCDIWWYGMLTAKFESAKALRAQVIPELAFGIGAGSSQRLGCG
jgi:hypothetical protein